VERLKPGRNSSRESKKESRWGFRGMTVRDWLELLVVPLVLVGIGLLFEMQQAERQQAMEEQQQALEERRAEAERELADQRAQDEALQAYLDQMSTLLLEKDLRSSEEDSEVRTLARSRTLTVLGGLDASRKTEVMRFLIEVALVQRVDGRDPIIALNGADLDGVNLGDPSPYLVDLKADLSGADLGVADLRKAYLLGVNLAEANLRGANLSEADLSFATLSDTNLHLATLSKANLEGANLSGANLKGAILDEANLSNVEGVTRKELEQQPRSLEDAIMPDGSKHD
jgi:uncharacterized protein YjbI with pentapeptide repeats